MRGEVILRLVRLADSGSGMSSRGYRRGAIRSLSRDAVRRLAADELDVGTERVQLVFDCRDCLRGNDGSHGQPLLLLDGNPAPVRVSYSRSGDWLLAALSFRPVLLGVDLEDTGSAAFGEADNIDAVMLTPDERTLLARAVDRRRLRAQLWTRKEAVLKSTGHGLRLAPDEVGVADADGSALLTIWPGAAGERPGVQLVDLQLTPAMADGTAVPPTLTAALAIGGSADPGVIFRETLAVPR